MGGTLNGNLSKAHFTKCYLCCNSTNHIFSASPSIYMYESMFVSMNKLGTLVCERSLLAAVMDSDSQEHWPQSCCWRWPAAGGSESGERAGGRNRGRQNHCFEQCDRLSDPTAVVLCHAACAWLPWELLCVRHPSHSCHTQPVQLKAEKYHMVSETEHTW